MSGTRRTQLAEAATACAQTHLASTPRAFGRLHGLRRLRDRTVRLSYDKTIIPGQE